MEKIKIKEGKVVMHGGDGFYWENGEWRWNLAHGPRLQNSLIIDLLNTIYEVEKPVEERVISPRLTVRSDGSYVWDGLEFEVSPRPVFAMDDAVNALIELKWGKK